MKLTTNYSSREWKLLKNISRSEVKGRRHDQTNNL